MLVCQAFVWRRKYFLNMLLIFLDVTISPPVNVQLLQIYKYIYINVYLNIINIHIQTLGDIFDDQIQQLVFLVYSCCRKDVIQGLDLYYLSYCFEFKSEKWHSFLNYSVDSFFFTLFCMLPFCHQTHLFFQGLFHFGGASLHSIS